MKDRIVYGWLIGISAILLIAGVVNLSNSQTAQLPTPTAYVQPQVQPTAVSEAVFNAVRARTYISAATGTLTNLTATTITATTLISQAVGFSSTDATITNITATQAVFTGASATYLTGTLGTANQPNVTNLGTQTYLSATNFALGGQVQTGAVRYGTAATYTSGASITHGFTVTPTACIASPEREVTATLTITTTGFSWDTASRATPIFWVCGK